MVKYFQDEALRARLSGDDGSDTSDSVQPASIDLKVSLKESILLEVGKEYIIDIKEQILDFVDMECLELNQKSSLGRIGVYSMVMPYRGVNNKIHFKIKVKPLFFPIIINDGDSLSQLRVRSSKIVATPVHREKVVADLSECWVSFSKKDKKAYKPIDLNKRKFYDPHKYFQKINLEKESLNLEDAGYALILAKSKNMISIPPSQCAEMSAMNINNGLVMNHIAGFFDPGFGYGVETYGMFEIVVGGVNTLLTSEFRHNGIEGYLDFFDLYKTPNVSYGEEKQSNYQGQRLALAKYFKDIEL
jgi:dCTP deaminase